MNIRDRIKELRRVPANELRPNPNNWRTHPEEQLNAIRGVLAEVGFAGAELARELEDGTLELIDGHARAEVAGTAEVPVLVLDVDEAEANKILATFDPIGAMAESDAVKLDAVLRDVDTGSEALQEMLADLADDADLYLDDEPEVVEDEVPEPPSDPVTQPGDVWLLGRHRLLCGDSCKKESYKLLLTQKKANLVLTDPPYGMSYRSNKRTASKKFDQLKNDDKILTDWIAHTKASSKGWVFCFTTWKVLSQWMQPFKAFGDITNMVVWFKGGGGIGDLKKTFFTDHEIALVTNRGAELKGKRIGSVWTFGKDAATEYKHPTQKPVALLAEAIDKTTDKGDAVLDPFLGSGTTLIAAEQLGRTCYGMELSPEYCDVIVERWQNLTGEKATRENGTA